MSSYGMTLTILATGLAEAVAKDDLSEDGYDLAAGMFGRHVSDWLRSVAEDFDVANAVPTKYDAGDTTVGDTKS
jgi:hypothetical protein